MSKKWQIFWFFLLLFALLTKLSPDSWNDTSRMATIQSLVEQHTFIIDKSTFFSTGDKYFYQGHFYSDKPPILSIYASIFYFFLRLVGISFDSNKYISYYLLTLLVIGVSTCIGLVYFYKIIKLFEIDDKWANISLLVAGTSTLILTYTTVFNNHIVAGSLLLISFYYLLKTEESAKFSFITGFLVTLAGSIDIAAFSFLPFYAIAFLSKSLRLKIIFIFASALILFVYFYLNVHTSGSLIPPAMNKTLWDYPGSAFSESSLSGVAYHTNIFDLLRYAFNMLIGGRGLFSYTPILIFSIFGFTKVIADKNFKYRKEYLLVFLALCVYILMYILRSNNYSGRSYGVRWYVDLMFILCLPIAHIANDIQKSKALKISFFVIAMISLFISFLGVNAPFPATISVPFVSVEDNIYSFIKGLTYTLMSNKTLIKLRFILINIIFLGCVYNFYSYYKKFLKSSRSQYIGLP